MFLASSQSRPTEKITGFFDAGAKRLCAIEFEITRPLKFTPYSLSREPSIAAVGATTTSAASNPARTRRPYSSYRDGGALALTARHHENTHECAPISTGLS